MADISGSYDPNAAPSGDFDPLPAGEYRARIIESDVEDISKRDNKGRCLKLTWQVETGAFDGRLIWQRLNMWGENMGPNTDKVVQIANAQFAGIREATGKMAPQDSIELHDIPCMIRVAVKTDPTGQYQPQNEIKSVKPLGGTAAGSAPAPTAQRQAPAAGQQRATPPAGGNASAPWRQRQTA